MTYDSSFSKISKKNNKFNSPKGKGAKKDTKLNFPSYNNIVSKQFQIEPHES